MFVVDNVSPFNEYVAVPTTCPLWIGAVIGLIVIVCSILFSFPFSIKHPEVSSNSTLTVLLTPLLTFIVFTISPFLANCLKENLLKP